MNCHSEALEKKQDFLGVIFSIQIAGNLGKCFKSSFARSIILNPGGIFNIGMGKL